MKSRLIKLPPPYLRSVWLDLARVPEPAAYPFCLPFLSNEFQLEFERPITIIVGENGTGKSTLLEGIAALAGYDEAGGGKGYRPVDHSQALEAMGGRLAKALGCHAEQPGEQDDDCQIGQEQLDFLIRHRVPLTRAKPGS